MCLLIVSCFAFLALHLGISGTPLGELLQNPLSESLYLSVYSLLSLGSLGVVIYGYVQVPHVGFIWVPSVLAYKVAKVFMLLALVTIVMGALVKTPTAVMSERVLDYEVSGLLNITRHPILWSVLLFARAHLCSLIAITLQFCFLERLFFCPSLGCYRWIKGAGRKVSQNGGFS